MNLDAYDRKQIRNRQCRELVANYYAPIAGAKLGKLRDRKVGVAVNGKVEHRGADWISVWESMTGEKWDGHTIGSNR